MVTATFNGNNQQKPILQGQNPMYASHEIISGTLQFLPRDPKRHRLQLSGGRSDGVNNCPIERGKSLQAFLAEAQQGDIIRMAAGIYRFAFPALEKEFAPLHIPDGVCVKGDGRGLTVLEWVEEPRLPAYVTVGDGVDLRDLTVRVLPPVSGHPASRSPQPCILQSPQCDSPFPWTFTAENVETVGSGHGFVAAGPGETHWTLRNCMDNTQYGPRLEAATVQTLHACEHFDR